MYRKAARSAWGIVLLVVAVLLGLAATEAELVNWAKVATSVLVTLNLMEPTP